MKYMRPVYTKTFLLYCILFGVMHYSCNQEQRENKKATAEIISPGINEIVNQIAKYSRVDTRGVGFAGVKTEQYERFEKLIKLARPEELINLTNHQSPAVRAYSFWALAEKKLPGLELIVKKHAKDTSSFELFAGCLLLSERVNDFYVAINKNSR